MKCLLSVCLAVVAGIAAYVLDDYAQTPMLRKGVSVQMAVTQNAVAMPAADEDDAWVIAVTADGKLYFGVKPVTARGLAEEMRILPHRREQNLYIKADARAPFASVQRAVAIGRESFFDSPVLLTSQPGQAAPGKVVPPRGLEVMASRSSAGPESVIVRIVQTGPGAAALEVNHEKVSWDGLQSTLQQTLPGNEKVVVVKAGGKVPFASVVRVMDACSGAGAKAALAVPEV
jgi:biopolymer transport protein ExbD